MHLGADLRGAGERLLPQIRRRRRVEPGRDFAPLYGGLVDRAASLALAYWSTETVTFFFPSALEKTTDLTRSASRRSFRSALCSPPW